MAFCRSDEEANECEYADCCRKGCQYQIVDGEQGQARNEDEQLYIFVCIEDARIFKKDNGLHGQHRIVPILVSYDDF